MQKMKMDTPPIETTGSESHQPVITDPKLLRLLVCPQTKGPLIWDRAASELISVQAGLAFPVKDGVPLLQMQLARALSVEEVSLWKRK